MNKDNTVIIGVLGEPPYAEFKGDVGVPYCQAGSPLSGTGCMYYYVKNDYLLEQQRATLNLAFDPYDQRVINTVRQQDSDIPLVTVLFQDEEFDFKSYLPRLLCQEFHVIKEVRNKR